MTAKKHKYKFLCDIRYCVDSLTRKAYLRKIRIMEYRLSKNGAKN